MRLRRTAAALLGLLVLSPALAACGEDADELSAGDVVPARDDNQFVEGAASFLMLPIGRLEIQLGEPVQKLRAGDTRDRTAVDAPAGTTFVPITWQYDAGTFMEYADFLGEAPSPVIDLVTEGAHYRIPSPSEEGIGAESFYVAVTGSGAEPSLKVEFDGVTQTVDLTTGKRNTAGAAGLYDIKTLRKKKRPCTADLDYHGDEGRPQLTCTIGKVTALPYAAGAWAPKDRTWLAFPVTTELTRYVALGSEPASGAFYYAESVKSSFKVGGTAPSSVSRSPESLCPDPTNASCSDVQRLVVDAPKKGNPRLLVDLTYALRVVTKWGGFDGKTRRKLHATGRIPIR